MPRRAKVMAPSLTDETRSMLAVLARSRTAPAHHVERSAIILHLADRRSASETAAALGIDRERVTHCARRAAAVDRLRQSTTCRVRDAGRTLQRRRGLG